MPEYSAPGFKMVVPDDFKWKGNFPLMYFENDRVVSGGLYIRLLDKSATFEEEEKIRLAPSNVWPVRFYDFEIIKDGDYSAFSGAKCRFVDRVPTRGYNRNRTLFWEILVPVKNRLVSISGVAHPDEGEVIDTQISSPEAYRSMADVWLPMVNSMEFDPQIIATLPDSTEAARNGNQARFNRQGLKFSYPAGLRQTGTIHELWLKDHSSPQYGCELSLELHPRNSTFNVFHKQKTPDRQLLPDYRNECEFKFIRGGEFAKFAGAGEWLFAYCLAHGKASYNWSLAIPVGNRVIELTASCNELADIDKLWLPVIESLEFDVDTISALPNDNNITSYSWKKTATGQSQHVRVEFCAQEHFLGLYTVKNKLFTDAEADNDFAVVVDLIEKKWAKKSKRLLLSLNSDPVAWPVDFYLNTEPPAESDVGWGEIIEGFINLSSGKLFASSDYDDPGIEIVFPQKGIYKFRVYFAGADLIDTQEDYEEDLWQIYFWPTDEIKESNTIKVIKAFNQT